MTPAQAAEERTIEDETVYDILVDRFFNKEVQNDYDVDTRDANAFNGGDFAGLLENLEHVEKLGFTMLSIGPIFATDSYDGREVSDYSLLERHFGTAEELKAVIEEAHDRGIRIIVDVPTQKLSADHLWIQEYPEWATENEDGTFALNTENPDVQKALIEAFREFINTYNVDGLRLQDTDELAPEFINVFADSLKEVRPLYILSDSPLSEEAAIDLDATVLPEAEEVLREAYRTADTDTAALIDLMERSEGQLIRIDSLESSRFTAGVLESTMYPPTRWKLVFAQLLSMPGIPVVQYGSEIAVTGSGPPESHDILNLRVDEELINYIGDWTSLRNESEALRTGELEVLAADDGWFVYKRSNEEESWIIAINNTTDTQHLTIPGEVIGNSQEMRGLFESDIVRQNDEGDYQITLNRELAEAYTVMEERGLNSWYFVALALVFVLFVLFLWLVWRRGKRPAQQ
ncbi:alpha-amlyase [Planococcus lenghuensis]|uniref:Alpha-amlyase n=2 Tax=Planococcus lenghuensis TaxID=2213202 RepID=A0A1Q2L3U1_9BACL|nr:alpha-amlyase [Planococcus lenghuensis]